MSGNSEHKLLVLSLLLLILISNIQNTMGLVKAETISTQQLYSYGIIKYPSESGLIIFKLAPRTTIFGIMETQGGESKVTTT